MKTYFLLSFFLLVFSAFPVFAQEEVPIATEAATPIVSAPDYALPYPGLLPDNPLYIIKVARDRIVGFLIHEPLKKAEFNLLQADKRMNAASFLFKKDRSKEELALSTAAKALNYYEEGVVKAIEAKEHDVMVHDFANTMFRAADEYAVLLSSMESSRKTSFADTYELLQERIVTLQQKVETDLLDSSSPAS